MSKPQSLVESNLKTCMDTGLFI